MKDNFWKWFINRNNNKSLLIAFLIFAIVGIPNFIESFDGMINTIYWWLLLTVIYLINILLQLKSYFKYKKS